MSSTSIKLNSGSCFSATHSSCAAKAKNMTLTVVVALTAIAAVTLTLMVLAQQGFQLGALNSIADKIAANWLYVGLGVVGACSIIEILTIVAMVRSQLNKIYSQKELNKSNFTTDLNDHIEIFQLKTLMGKNAYYAFELSNGSSSGLSRTAYALVVKDRNDTIALTAFRSEYERDAYISNLGTVYKLHDVISKNVNEYTREYVEFIFGKEEVSKQISEMSSNLPESHYLTEEFSFNNPSETLLVMVVNDKGTIIPHFYKSREAAETAGQNTYVNCESENVIRQQVVEKNLPNVKLSLNQFISYEVEVNGTMLYAVAYLDMNKERELLYFTREADRQKFTTQLGYCCHKELNLAFTTYIKEPCVNKICVNEKDYWLCEEICVSEKRGNILAFFLDNKFQAMFFQAGKAAEFISQNQLVNRQKLFNNSEVYPYQLGQHLAPMKNSDINHIFRKEFNPYKGIETQNKHYPEMYRIFFKDEEGKLNYGYFKTEKAQDACIEQLEKTNHHNSFVRNREEKDFAELAMQGIWANQVESERKDRIVNFVHDDMAHVIPVTVKGGLGQDTYESLEKNHRLAADHEEFLKEWKRAPLSKGEEDILKTQTFSASIAHWITKENLQKNQYVVRKAALGNYNCIISCREESGALQRKTFFFKVGDPEFNKHLVSLKGYEKRK